MNHYRVFWKFEKQKAVTQDYQAADLKSVLRILHRSHNVCPTTVQEMVVHEIRPDGKVCELLEFSAPAKPTLRLPSPASVPDTWQERVRAVTKSISPSTVRTLAEQRPVEPFMLREVREILEDAKKDPPKKPHLKLVQGKDGPRLPIHWDANGLYMAKEV